MASGQELATAYLSLTVSAKGINKDIARELSGADSMAESAGRSMGSRLGDGLKAGAKVAGVAIAAVLGVALTKGFGRLSAIEDAQASLSGLGNSAEDVSAIMKNALASVKGTAFGMDEAASTAAGAVAAGIKPGEDLEKVLRLVGDAATIGGSSMGEMGAIFNKVATSNKVQGDVIAQLNDRGIPIVQMLGKQLGVTSEEVTKMASEGKIGFETFRAAMEDGLGGAALKSGETTKGAFKNMMAALSRIGAGLLGGVFPHFKTVFTGITGMLDNLETKLTPLADAFGKGLVGALTNLWSGLSMGAGVRQEFAGDLEGFVLVGSRLRAGWDVLAGVVASLHSGLSMNASVRQEFAGDLEGWVLFGSRVRAGFDAVKGALSDFHAGLTMNAGVREEFSGQLEGMVKWGAQVRSVFDAVGTAVGQLDFSSWHGFTGSLAIAGGTIGATLGPAMSSMGESLKTLAPAAKEFAKELPNIGGAVAKVAAGGLTVLTSVLGFLADHVDTIILMMPLIVAGFIAWRIASTALAAGTYTMQAAQLAMTPVITLNNVLRLTAIRLENQQTAASARNTLAQGTNTAALNLGAAAQVRTTLASRALGLATGQYSVKMIASAVATKAAAAGQRVLNLAMRANPIGLIITAVTALVAGLVWFFTKTETGQKIVAAAWAGIKAAVSTVVDWFQDHVMPVLSAIWDGISAGAMWLWENGIKPAWDGIMAAVQVVVGFFQNTVLPIIQTVFAAVGAVFTWLYATIIKPVFDLIVWAVNAWWTIVSGIFQVAVAIVRNVLAPAFTWLWESVIQPVFGWIGNLISTWWAGAKIVFNAVVGFVRDTLGAAFTWFKDSVITPVFNGIKWLITTWWTGAKIVFEAVVGFLRNTLGVAFTWFKDSIITPVWDGIKAVISGVWNNGIKPIFDTISDAVQNKLPSAFEAAKDGIGKAWDKIKDIAKMPVEFVVNKVINDGLIDTFNKIPGVDIKRIPLPPGFRKGGYTGDVGKDDVAGVVHGKEYVFTAEQTAAIGKDRLAQMARNAGSAAVAGGGNMGGFFTGNTGNIRKHGAYHLDVPSSMAPWNFPGAARMWDGAAGIKVAIGRGNAQGYASPRERGGGILGFASGNNIDMSPQWMNTLNAVQRQTVAAHEMGHAMGLPHNSGHSIMQPNLARMAPGPTIQDIVNLQSLYPGGSGKAGSAVPDNPFSGLIDTLMGKFKSEFPAGGMMVDAAGGLAKAGINQVAQTVQDIKDGLKDLAGDVFGKVKGFFGGGAAMAPTVYDGGGWLEKTGRPQLVQHNRTKPDAVLSSEQWGTMTRIAQNSSSGTGGGVTINGDVYGATPEQIVDEWDTKQRRAASMHNLRKVMVA